MNDYIAMATILLIVAGALAGALAGVKLAEAHKEEKR